MSKAHNQKGQNSKNQNQSDSMSQGSEDRSSSNLDSNQSNQSMSSGMDDTSTLSLGRDEEGATASDTEGSTANDFGQPQDLQDGQSYSHLSGSDSSSQSSGDSQSGIMAKAASLIDTQAVKKNLNLVKTKAQDLMASSKEQMSNRMGSISDDVKLRGMMVDDSVKANPYAYALGAVGLGFILGRAFSGKGKGDLDMLVSTVNKLNLSTLTTMLGMKGEAETGEQPNYNSDQARKIG